MSAFQSCNVPLLLCLNYDKAMVSKLFSAMYSENGPAGLFLLGAILVGVGVGGWIAPGAGLMAAGLVILVLGFLLGQN